MGFDLAGFGSVADLLKVGIEKIWPNPAEAAAAKIAIMNAEQSGALKEMDDQFQISIEQIKTNAVEAASPSLFVAGARPFIMWVCGIGLATSCIIAPLFTWASALFGHPTPFPNLNDPLLQSTLAGLLGLGHISRTIEKIKGVVGQH
jgi:hypothetical protein